LRAVEQAGLTRGRGLVELMVCVRGPARSLFGHGMSPILCLRVEELMLALGISPFGWLIFLGIVLLLFGSRLPSLARSLGQSIVEFKKGMKELEDHSDEGATPKDRHL
jgi:TatA/E family protein of Tat protein translocase